MFSGLLVSPFPHCCCSVAKSCPTLCDPVDCSVQGFSVLHYLLEFVQIHVPESVMPSTHLILCCPLLLLPPIPPSISLFQWVNSSHEVAKVLEFQFSISPSKEHAGLILRMDWSDVLAVQGTLKSLLQHHSSKASILWHSAFFNHINSSALSFLHSPTLTSIHDHWKNHSLD